MTMTKGILIVKISQRLLAIMIFPTLSGDICTKLYIKDLKCQVLFFTVAEESLRTFIAEAYPLTDQGLLHQRFDEVHRIEEVLDLFEKHSYIIF